MKAKNMIYALAQECGCSVYVLSSENIDNMFLNGYKIEGELLPKKHYLVSPKAIFNEFYLSAKITTNKGVEEYAYLIE